METQEKAVEGSPADDALAFAETLFDGDMMAGYRTIQGFFDLYEMVKPEDRPKLFRIYEWLFKANNV